MKIACLFVSIFLLIFVSQASAEPTVIFLNGCSSAGKTSIVRELQEQLSEPYLHVGFDHFLFMLPNRYILEGAQSHLGFRFERVDDEEGPKVAIHRGVYGRNLSGTMRATMTNLLDQGFNLIIDEGLFFEDEFLDYLTALQNYKVYFISIKPPIEVAEARELQRRDRMIGLSRGLYKAIYENKVVDLELDSSVASPADLAEIIIDYIRQEPSPKAFKQNYLHVGLAACLSVCK